MGDLLLTLLFFIAVIGLIVYLARPRVLFTIVIHGGEVSATNGSPPDAFLDDVRAICSLWKISNGTLRVSVRALVRIKASGDAAAHRQAFLNAWNNPIRV